MNPYSGLCDDFGVAVYINTKTELPNKRETVLNYFDNLKKTFPEMTDFEAKPNGEFVLEEEKDAEMRGHALALIKSSANEASARLQFCRLAFGAAGSKGASIDTGDAELVTRQLLSAGRTKLTWSMPRVLM